MFYLRFHVDLRILGERRAWLEEARVTLEEDTHGTLRVFYDYDFDSTEPMQNLDGWRIVDIAESAPVVAYFDEFHKTKVIGECDGEKKIVYLVRERIETHDRFVHVAMHEILHAVGLPHVKGDAHAIMAPILFSRLPLHMSPTDLNAFCAKIRCKEIL